MKEISFRLVIAASTGPALARVGGRWAGRHTSLNGDVNEREKRVRASIEAIANECDRQHRDPSGFYSEETEIAELLNKAAPLKTGVGFADDSKVAADVTRIGVPNEQPKHSAFRGGRLRKLLDL